MKKILKIPRKELVYGKGTGVTFAEAKRAFLSGMSARFKKNVKVKFI